MTMRRRMPRNPAVVSGQVDAGVTAAIQRGADGDGLPAPSLPVTIPMLRSAMHLPMRATASSWLEAAVDAPWVSVAARAFQVWRCVEFRPGR